MHTKLRLEALTEDTEVSLKSSAAFGQFYRTDSALYSFIYETLFLRNSERLLRNSERVFRNSERVCYTGLPCAHETLFYGRNYAPCLASLLCTDVWV
jgi:hypothetical protein